jgi:hypothetical protein
VLCRTESVVSIGYACGSSAKYTPGPASSSHQGLPDVTKNMIPRLTQVIQLQEEVTLIDALVDFDIDAACILYDGRTVRALKRAELAIQHSVIMVRPSVLQHKRNKARVRKYVSSSVMRALYFDGLCRHSDPCRPDELINSMLRPHSQHPGYGRPQRQQEKNHEGITWTHKACCEVKELEGGFEASQSSSYSKLNNDPGHVLRYFKERWGWSKSTCNFVEELPLTSLWCCNTCKGDYRLSNFPDIEQANTLDGDQDTPEDGDLATEVGLMRISK